MYVRLVSNQSENGTGWNKYDNKKTISCTVYNHPIDWSLLESRGFDYGYPWNSFIITTIWNWWVVPQQPMYTVPVGMLIDALSSLLREQFESFFRKVFEASIKWEHFETHSSEFQSTDIAPYISVSLWFRNEIFQYHSQQFELFVFFSD